MIKTLRQALKKYPRLVALKRHAWQRFRDPLRSELTTHNILLAFPAFIPYSAGTYPQNAALTIQSINQCFPFLASLAGLFKPNLTVTNIEDFPQTDGERAAARELKNHFDEQGSDKANPHNYHYLYGPILSDRKNIKGIFEIGLGTNNTDIVSNMGRGGRPGASLRAFSSFCPSALIHGADVDTRVLFSEDRIKTFHVDQTNPSTFNAIPKTAVTDLDLIIDDGLHSPDANIASLEFGLKHVKAGGWVVVEDIGADAIPIWHVVASLIPPDRYKCFLLDADGIMVFAVNRLS